MTNSSRAHLLSSRSLRARRDGVCVVLALALLAAFAPTLPGLIREWVERVGAHVRSEVTAELPTTS